MDFWQAYVVFISTLAMIWAMKEVYEMVTVRKLWQSILNDPEVAGNILGNAMAAFVKKLDEDKEFEQAFVGILQNSGIIVAEGIRQKFTDENGNIKSLDLPKRHILKPVESYMDRGLQWLFGNVEKQTVETAKGAVEEKISTMYD